MVCDCKFFGVISDMCNITIVNKTEFKYPSQTMIKRHGNFYCVKCRKERGEKVKGLVPMRYRGICYKKDFCVCEEHLNWGISEELKREVAERRESSDAVNDLMNSWGV